MAVAAGIKPEAFNGFDPAAFLPGASMAAATASLDALVAFNRRSAKTHSGIWRDLAVRKRKTEVEAQLGADRRGRPAPWRRHAADRAADRAHPRYRGRPAAARLGDPG